jgi:hypothetical protein
MAAQVRRRPITNSDVNTARKLFYVGCFGLPWLWICSAWYYHKLSLSADISDRSSAARKEELSVWVNRAMVGGTVAVVLLVAWNVYFQVNWRDHRGFLVYDPDEGGWETDL